MTYTLKDAWVLLFALFLPLLFILTKRIRIGASFIFSTEDLVRGIRPTMRSRLTKAPLFLRALAIALMLFALARPQSVLEGTKTTSEGVDIVMAIDTSTSMLAEDFRMQNKRMNRFDVVRDLAKEFIAKRRDDRIGMVAFAARAYTVCPLATDYDWLYENIDRVRVGMLEDATAIGSAIASSVSRLRTSRTKSKIIILLTDGVNNAGSISPLLAAEAAKALGIKIYTIGVGTKGLVPYPFKDVYGRTIYQNISIEIDEALLKRIAEITGGKYYRATDTETLRTIYDEINRLEKSNIEHFGYRETSELFGFFLIPGLLILALEIFLANTIFLRIP